jgi:hypothetical protein
MEREIERVVMDCIKGEAERRAVGLAMDRLAGEIKDLLTYMAEDEDEDMMGTLELWLGDICSLLSKMCVDLMGSPWPVNNERMEFDLKLAREEDKLRDAIDGVEMKPEWVKPENAEDYQKFMAFMREDRERRHQAMADAANEAARDLDKFDQYDQPSLDELLK